MNPGAFIGALILIVLVLAAIFAPFIAPYSWEETFVGPSLGPPSIDHLFGTDVHGRDVFSRILYGGRFSLSVGIATVIFSLVFGSIFGLVIAYSGGRVDEIGIMVIDVMLGFPSIMLALLIVAVLGVGLTNVVVAVGIAGIPPFARVIRGAALAVKARPFIEATRALGAGQWRIIFRHLLPNVLAVITVMGTLNLASAILSTATLSFLGPRCSTAHSRMGRNAQQQSGVHALRSLDHDRPRSGPLHGSHVRQPPGRSFKRDTRPKSF